MRLAVVVAASLVCSVALAQSQNPQISYEAITAAPQGAWAEYVTSMKGQTQKLTMRYALVEKSAKKMALEIDGTTPMGQLIMRMEFTPAKEPNAWQISAAKVSMGGQPPQDMPVPANTPLLKKGEDLGEVVGKSSVKTAVGTFDTKQYKKAMPQGTLNMWMSDKVLPVGLVKQELADGQLSTILTATGTGATSKMASIPAKPAANDNKPAAGDKAKAAP